MVKMVWPDSPEHPAPMLHMIISTKRNFVSTALLGQRDLKEPSDQKDHPGIMEQLVIMDRQEKLDKTVHPVQPATQEEMVQEDIQVNQEKPAQSMTCQGHLARSDQLDLRDNQEIPVNPVSRVKMDWLEWLELQAMLVTQERTAIPVCQEVPGSMEKMEL